MSAETTCCQSFCFSCDSSPLLCVNPDFLSISHLHRSHLYIWVGFLSKDPWQARTHRLEFCSHGFQPVFPAKQVENMCASEYSWQISVPVVTQWQWWKGTASLLGLVHRQKQTTLCHSFQILYFLFPCWYFVMSRRFYTSKLCSLNMRKRTLNFLSQFNLN